VVKKCLAKDPDDRWQSARDIKTTLEWIDEGEDPAASSTLKHNPWRERAAWMLGLVLLSTMTFFADGHYRTPSAGEPARFSVYPPEKAVFSGPPNITVPVPQFALSPDGRAMVFVANSSGADPVIWLRTIDQVTPRPLPGTEYAQSPFWSPDSRWLGFFAEGKLKKISVAGGPVQVLTDVADAFGGSWGADGSIIFGKLSSAIFRVSSGGGVVTAVTKVGSIMNAHRWPQFLPDGRHFLFHVQSGERERHGVYVGSLDAAMARDGQFFSFVDRIQPTFRTPSGALLFHGCLAGVLVLTGTFEEIYFLGIFSIWIFVALTAIALIGLRKKEPSLPRPYRAWGYPWTPLIVATVAFAISANLWLVRPVRSSIRLAVILLGIPFFRRLQKRATDSSLVEATPSVKV
jgi:hypothetical protein